MNAVHTGVLTWHQLQPEHSETHHWLQCSRSVHVSEWSTEQRQQMNSTTDDCEMARHKTNPIHFNTDCNGKHLQSATTTSATAVQTRNELGDHAFSVATQLSWNSPSWSVWVRFSYWVQTTYMQKTHIQTGILYFPLGWQWTQRPVWHTTVSAE